MDNVRKRIIVLPHINIGTKYILCTLLIGALYLAIPGSIPQAAERDEVDTLMEGFGDDEPLSEKQEHENLEDILSGGDEVSDGHQSRSQPDRKEPTLSLDGYFKLGATWNVSHDAPETGETDWRGLSKLRSEAQVDALAKLGKNWRLLVSGKLFYDAAYGLRGRDEFTDEVIDEYEQEAEWRETYLQGCLGPPLDFKTGRQIVVWGRSDNLRITDVLNPLDLREPGLTDIEDLRLPVAMTRMDGFWRQWNLTGIAIHEIRFNKNPVFGNDFFSSPMPLPPEEKPSEDADNTQWALALNGIFSGKDISFYWADIFDETPHANLNADGRWVQKHARVTMWGAAGNLAIGNWLLKGEAAYWRGLKFFNSDENTHQRVDGLAGMEYSGWDDTTISFDWAVKHMIDFDKRMENSPDFAQEDEISNALRVTRTYWSETLELTLLGLVYGPLAQDGSLVRISAEYDWSDTVDILFGTVLYQSGDRYALRQIGDNDRLFAEIKYSF